MKPAHHPPRVLPALLGLALGLAATVPPAARARSPSARASAGTIAATDPRQLLAFARTYGRASLDLDRDGDPHIRGQLDGHDYQIFFYGCRHHGDCDEIQMIASWPDKRPSLTRINRWNNEKRMARAYLSPENGLTVDVDAVLDSGIPRAALDGVFDGFRNALSQLDGWPDGDNDDGPDALAPGAKNKDTDDASKPNVVI